LCKVTDKIRISKGKGEIIYEENYINVNGGGYDIGNYDWMRWSKKNC
jgi:hypothetical protein